MCSMPLLDEGFPLQPAERALRHPNATVKAITAKECFAAKEEKDVT
jgi:hypothetical protein